MNVKFKFKKLAAIMAVICLCMIFRIDVAEESASAEQTDDPYVVTCIGDSSPNGSCLGHIATAPNCSPNTRLHYTHSSTYTMDDGTVIPLDGSFNGEKRVDYSCFLPDGVTPEEYEKDALKAYPVLVAESMNGIKNGSIKDFETFYEKTDYRSMTAAMLRSGDVLYALDRTYYQDDNMWKLPVTETKREELVEAVDEGAIEDADCIILSIGANDVFAGPMYEMIYASSKKTGKISAMKSAIREGIGNFQTNFPRIMKELQKRNSKCTYVITGVGNPVSGYTVHDMLKLLGINTGLIADALPAGNLVDKILDPINETMQQVADRYSNVIYADSDGINLYMDELAAGNDVEVPVSHNASVTADGTNASAVSGNPLANSIHPTEKGHRQMARRILGAISQIASDDPYAITADAGEMDRIRYVLCDGENAEYSVSEDGKTVTLSGNGKDTVTVKIIGQKGGIPLEKSWNCRLSDNGYWSKEN